MVRGGVGLTPIQAMECRTNLDDLQCCVLSNPRAPVWSALGRLAVLPAELGGFCCNGGAVRVAFQGRGVCAIRKTHAKSAQ